jgi:hypothetical protein
MDVAEIYIRAIVAYSRFYFYCLFIGITISFCAIVLSLGGTKGSGRQNC